LNGRDYKAERGLHGRKTLKRILKIMGWEDLDWIRLAQDKVQWGLL
jgi:hypothetical protein